MKKAFLILLALSLLLTFSSCTTDKNGEDVLTDEHGHPVHDHTHAENETGEASSQNTVHSHNPSGPALTYADSLELTYTETFSSEEAALYNDFFMNKNYAAYENKTFTKSGTFAILYDTFSNVTRYYVWGYASEAKDRSYQWEFIMPEGTTLPTPGSLIEVSGTMINDSNALDKYRLDNVTLTVKEEASASDFDYDFLTLSPTLRRVQIDLIEMYPENFSGKTLRIYGNALSEVTIGDADAVGSWSVHFSASKDHLDTNTKIVIEGSFNVTSHGEGEQVHYAVSIDSQAITAIS